MYGRITSKKNSKSLVAFCLPVGIAASIFLVLVCAGLNVVYAKIPDGGKQTNEIKVADNIVLPKRPIGQALADAMMFLKKSDGAYVPGRGGEELAGYFLSATVNVDGMRIKPRLAYPARHHAYFILTFLRYYGYSGDKEWLLRARDLADWNIANSTDAEWACANLPYSTFSKGRPRGAHDKNSIEPDKAAFLGTAYVVLYEATGQSKYRTAAKKIADTLVKIQREDGSWPFRIVPEDGSVAQDFGGAPVFAVEFFERMLAKEPISAYRKAHENALAWMLQTNVQNNFWGTYHEDVSSREKTYLSAEPMCFTAAYLFRHSSQNKGYQEKGLQLLKRIKEHFVHKSEHPISPAPGVAEQPDCPYIMPGHTARYCSLLADLYALTGNDEYRQLAISGINSTTFMQTENGLFRTWIWNVDKKQEKPAGRDWYSQHLYTVFHILGVIARFPQIAPENENHLIGSTVPVRSIVYARDRITFETAMASTAILKLSFTPRYVKLNGQFLKASENFDESTVGWFFDPKIRFLRVRHGEGIVEIIRGWPATEPKG